MTAVGVPALHSPVFGAAGAGTPSALPHAPGTETQTSYLKYEFWFEWLVESPAHDSTDWSTRAVAATKHDEAAP